MASLTKTCVFIAVFSSALIGLLSSVVRSDPSFADEISTICNDIAFAEFDPGAVSDVIETMLDDLVSRAPGYLPGPLYNSGSGVVSLTGRAQCYNTVTLEDCTTCLEAAESNLINRCNLRDGAQSNLAGCMMRYEDHGF